MPYHGRKPPSPQKVKQQHGRKPPAPPKRKGRSMQESSMVASPAAINLAWALILLPFLTMAGVVGYLLHGYGLL